jgi:sugar phosphate isomerase/epimerase
MDRLGIECLSVFGMPPVAFVHLAADLNCRYISTCLAPFSTNPHNYPAWSLREPRARREMKAVLRERGVSISLGEGLVILPNVDVKNYAADLDALCDLGVKRINTMSMDPDMGRTLDQFGALAQMAEAAGVTMMIEFVPIFTIKDLPDALAAVRKLGRNTRIMVDTMHLVRSGGSVADLAALDPALIGYVQLCDTSLAPQKPDYADEVMTERMVPGTGEAPLLDILAALPRDLVVGLEIPLLSRAQAGEGPHERVGHCVEAARKMLAQLEL